MIVLVNSSSVILDYLSLPLQSGLCFKHVCPPIKTVFPSVIKTGYITVTENTESGIENYKVTQLTCSNSSRWSRVVYQKIFNSSRQVPHL